MHSESSPAPRKTSRNAVFSLVTAIGAFLAVCIAVIPVPLTGYVCFPSGAVLAASAVWFGVRALRDIRNRGERGRGPAIAGMVLGGGSILLALCSALLLVLVGARLATLILQATR